MVLPRAVVAVFVVGLAHLGRPHSPFAVFAVAVWLGGTSVLSVAACAGGESRGSARARRRSLWALGADAAAVGALAVLLGAGPSGPALVLLPLLGLEIAFKTGPKGATAAAAAFTGVLALRVGLRTAAFGLSPRYGFMALLAAACAAFMAAGTGLYAKDRDRAGALAERDRIASLLRATVMELSSRAGRDPDSLEAAELSTLLDEACATASVGTELSKVLAQALSNDADPKALSPREQEVLDLLGSGMSDREIADALYLSPGTIRVHVSNSLKKLGVSCRADALAVMRQRAGRGASRRGDHAERHAG